MLILKNILIAVLSLLISYWLGRAALDTLFDVNVKGAFMRLLAVVVGIIVLLLLAVFKKELRWGSLAGVALCIGGVLFGFMFQIAHNTKIGLNVKWDDSVGSVMSDLSYGEGQADMSYDLYLPSVKSQDGTYALVLYIHGGSFTGGDKKEGEGWCKYMTAKGYVSASMNYTVHSEEHPSNVVLMTDQILQCVRNIQSKAADLGYPVTEMAVTGISAGGALALMYAYGKAEESPVPVKFVFEQTGPVYFDPIWWGNLNCDYEAQAAFVSMMSGETVTAEMVQGNEHMAIVDAISPASMVREGSVPTLCAYGPKDKIVPVGLKFHLLSALERCHVPYEYVEYPNSNHGMYSDPDAQREYVKKVNEYCEKYFDHH
ncbi:MAG: alpha/beta hydrolase [Blautia sp.]|nr:alpha/beta hydrolase [Blautia sp.]